MRRTYRFGRLRVDVEDRPANGERAYTVAIWGPADDEPRFVHEEGTRGERHLWVAWNVVSQMYDAADDPARYIAKETGGGRYAWHLPRAERIVYGAKLFRIEDLAQAAVSAAKKLGPESVKDWTPPSLGVAFGKEWSPRWKDIPEEAGDDILEAMARAIFVSTWADAEEREGRTYPGQELMDVAPPTPKEADDAAVELMFAMEETNRMPLIAMYEQALARAGILDTPDVRQDFGHLTAMQALGHGVSWSDDYRPHGLKIPHIEFSV